MRGISSLVGLLLFVLGTMGGFIMAGGKPNALFQIPLMMAVTVAPLGSAILAFGFRDVWVSLCAVRFLFFTPSASVTATRSFVVVRYLIISTYAVAGLAFLFVFIIVVASVGEPLAPTAMFFHHFAAATIALAYPLFISEGLLRPLKYRLEDLAHSTRTA